MTGRQEENSLTSIAITNKKLRPEKPGAHETP